MLDAFPEQDRTLKIEALSDSNVVLGVSLSNRVFDATFCEEFCKLIADSAPRSVMVFLGDEIEKINYTVFGKKSMEDATVTAVTRGLSLARMFKKACRALDDLDVHFDIRLESELRSSFFYGSDVKEIKASLKRLMGYSEEFRRDIYAQVRRNMQGRENRYGARFLEKNMDYLSEYIIGELAVFFSYYKKYKSVDEVYPGENLFVKEKIINGAYPKVRGIKYDIDYRYHDLLRIGGGFGGHV